MSVFAYIFFVICYWEHNVLPSCSAPCGLILLCKMCWNCLTLASSWLWTSPFNSTLSYNILDEINHSGHKWTVEIFECYSVMLSCDQEPWLIHSAAHNCNYSQRRFLFITGSYPHISFTSSVIGIDIPPISWCLHGISFPLFKHFIVLIAIKC